MTEMVDRLTRVLSGCLGKQPNLRTDKPPEWADCEAISRLMLETMREPTESMARAGAFQTFDDIGKLSWQTMIDDALADIPEESRRKMQRNARAKSIGGTIAVLIFVGVLAFGVGLAVG